jgi:hypothetical protein
MGKIYQEDVGIMNLMGIIAMLTAVAIGAFNSPSQSSGVEL